MAGVAALAMRGNGQTSDDFLTDTWTHPDTGVLIYGADLPRELIPLSHLTPAPTT
jgi:hypothetical protein